MGSGRDSALTSFNRAVGSYETRVVPQGRRIEELSGAQDSARLPESSIQIESQTREVNAPAAGDTQDE